MGELIAQFLLHLWDIILDASPWLLVGLIAAGLIKAFMPQGLLARWMGGRGWKPILRAALIGTPLPLCSCSVLPAAVTARREGASRGATVSFLIATPENGADSIALTYALMGPWMMIARPLAALWSAMIAGGLTSLLERPTPDADGQAAASAAAAAPCCHRESASPCCGGDDRVTADTTAPTVLARLRSGIRYAGGDLFNDIAPWLAFGLIMAAVVMTLAPPGSLSGWGQGLPVMLAMLVVGVPMYICATASTPFAAGLLLAGVSPGAVLVFLLAGPATNLGSIAVVRRELGWISVGAYLAGISLGALSAGILLDVLLDPAAVRASQAAVVETMPEPIAWLSAAIIGAMALRLTWRRIATRRRKRHQAPAIA